MQPVKNDFSIESLLQLEPTANSGGTQSTPAHTSTALGYQVSENSQVAPQVISSGAGFAVSPIRHVAPLSPSDLHPVFFSGNPSSSNQYMEGFTEQDMQDLSAFIGMTPVGGYQVPVQLPIHNLSAFKPVTSPQQIHAMPQAPLIGGRGLYLNSESTATMRRTSMVSDLTSSKGVEDDVLTQCGSPPPDLSPDPSSSRVYSYQPNIGGSQREPVLMSPKPALQQEGEPLCIGSGSTALERPPYTFPTLIRNAIMSQPTQRATLSEIYEWISVNFPFYNDTNKSSWQNSVRHNLSRIKAFKRSDAKAEHQKGSYWTIDLSVPMPSRKRRLEHSTTVDNRHLYMRPRESSEDQAGVSGIQLPELTERVLTPHQPVQNYFNMI